MPQRLLRNRFSFLPAYLHDPLGPIRFTSYFHALSFAPYLILLSLEPSTLSPSLRAYFDATSLSESLLKFTAFYSIGFLILLAGAITAPVSRLIRFLPKCGSKSAEFANLPAAYIIALLLGFSAYVYFLSNTGGIVELVRNLGNRQAYTEGMGYVLMLLSTLSFAAVITVLMIAKYRASIACKILAAATILFAIGAYSSTGGRKASITLALLCLFAYHYRVSPITNWRRLGLIALLVIGPYFIAMPLLRQHGKVDLLVSHPKAFAAEVAANSELLVKQLSYVETYVFITDYFTSHDKWLGCTYFDLLLAPVPSSLYPDKPPIDDGLYVRSLLEGYGAEPGQAFRSLYYSSMPPETYGSAFMNFGVFGVVGLMYLLGAFYRFAYEYARNCDWSFFSILLYSHCMLNFHYSNLRITQFVVFLLITAPFAAFVIGRKRTGFAAQAS